RHMAREEDLPPVLELLLLDLLATRGVAGIRHFLLLGDPADVLRRRKIEFRVGAVRRCLGQGRVPSSVDTIGGVEHRPGHAPPAVADRGLRAASLASSLASALMGDQNRAATRARRRSASGASSPAAVTTLWTTSKIFARSEGAAVRSPGIAANARSSSICSRR